MSAILTRELAARAVAMTIPSLDVMAEDGTIKRSARHIVIVDPTALPQQVAFEESDVVRLGDEDPEFILYEESFGNQEEWTGDYKSIARSKALLSHVYRMPTQLIQQRYPYLLVPGDTTFFGSAYADGLAVACSGVQPYFDEMIAWWVLSACRALAIEAVTTGAFSVDGDGFLS